MIQSNTVQVTIPKGVRSKIDSRAQVLGFDGAEDVMKRLLTMMAQGKISTSILRGEVSYVNLSKAAKIRYDSITSDVISGNNLYVADSVDDLMEQLDGNKDPVPSKIS